MGSLPGKMQCLGVSLAGALVLTLAVSYVLHDSYSGSPPPSALIQLQDHQLHWQQLGPPWLPGPVQLEAYQILWQPSGLLPSEGIERAERINEQMMRQRYGGYLKCLEEPGRPLVPSSLLFPDWK